jgi:hypothetical protein
MNAIMPEFQVVPVGNNCYTINDHGRTVALITSQGYIDWLLRSMDTPGELITEIVKETHLCYVLGLKILLITPSPATEITDFSYQVDADGETVTLRGLGMTADKDWRSETIAILTADFTTREYRWQLSTSLVYLGSESFTPPFHEWGFEYNNVYPHGTGRCMLFAPDKRYSCTLMTDKDETIWRFPHQHQLHYGHKTHALQNGPTSTAGFFGEPSPVGCPVVTVDNSPLEPFWPICDMFYDLHCCAKLDRKIQPGESWTFNYRIYYLDNETANQMLAQSRPVQITLDDWEQHERPRLDLGMNSFEHGCDIHKPDDCSAFVQKAPQMVWDKEVGHITKGSLRITNKTTEETLWSACPPTQIPQSTRLNITGKIMTKDVVGKGAYVQLRYHTFVWHPTPHVEWLDVCQSTPITGTSDGWVQITVPELKVPKEHFDYLVWIDFVVDGTGVAWLTDVDVDLQYDEIQPPTLQEGGREKQSNVKAKSGSSTGSGMVG